MERRRFVRETGVLAAAAGLAPRTLLAAEGDASARHIPRWRGFNLQGRFGFPGRPYGGPAFEEADFGVLDSGRDDVQYEDYMGHKLDRRMLELLKSG
jgi:hypothetical protein